MNETDQVLAYAGSDVKTCQSRLRRKLRQPVGDTPGERDPLDAGKEENS